MPTASAKRPWWKLHALTWAVLIAALWTIFVKNRIDGFAEHNRLFAGWPRQWATFSLADSGVFPFYVAMLRSPKVLDVIWVSLATNVLMWIALVGGSVSVMERWCRTGAIQFRVTLRTHLAFVALVGSALAFHSHAPDALSLDGLLFDLFFSLPQALAYLITLLAWLAFFDLFGIAWNRLSRRKT